MKHRKNHIALIFLAAGFIIGTPVSCFCQDLRRTVDMPVLGICSLYASTSQYQGKILSIAGRFERTFEGESLIDEGCVTGVEGLKIAYDCRTDAECREIQEPLIGKTTGNLLDGEIADVILVGRVEFRHLKANSNDWTGVIHVKKIEKVSTVLQVS
jgi:hypothetical protein